MDGSLFPRWNRPGTNNESSLSSLGAAVRSSSTSFLQSALSPFSTSSHTPSVVSSFAPSSRAHSSLLPSTSNPFGEPFSARLPSSGSLIPIESSPIFRENSPSPDQNPLKHIPPLRFNNESPFPGECFHVHPSLLALRLPPSRSPSPPYLQRFFALRCLLGRLPDRLQQIIQLPEMSLEPGSKRKFESIRPLDYRKKVCSGALDVPVPVPLAWSCEDVVAECDTTVTSFLSCAASQFSELVMDDSADSVTCLAETVGLVTVNSCPSAIECMLDTFIQEATESSLSPSSFAAHLDGSLRECDPRDFAAVMEDDDVSLHKKIPGETAIRVIHENFSLHLLDELKVCLDSLHTSLTIPSADVATMSVTVYRLLMALLYAMVCRNSTIPSLLERTENRKRRNWVMSAFFRAVLRPVVAESCLDVIVLSKAGLARLDAKQKKIPRDVVETVLRPALVQFCDMKKLDLRLVVGLHSIVELFPTLFKEVFARKILDMLSLFVDVTEVRRVFKMTDPEIREMVLYMLDFFRLFAMTGAFSCVPWMERIATLVLDLECSWQLVPNKSRGCEGFRSPLCRLLCEYPSQSACLIVENSSSPLAQVFSSVASCRHASPVKMKIAEMSSLFVSPAMRPMFDLGDQFSDVKLLMPCGRSIASHRVVLASRSEYFQKLLGNGMAETGQSVVPVDMVHFEVLQRVVGYLYQGPVETELKSLSIACLIDLLMVADRFVIDDLVDMCEHHLCSRIDAVTLPALLDFVCNQGTGDDDICDTLHPRSCGSNGGESILRRCQSYLLSNLTDCISTSGLEKQAIVNLLCATHSSLLRQALPC